MENKLNSCFLRRDRTERPCAFPTTSSQNVCCEKRLWFNMELIQLIIFFRLLSSSNALEPLCFYVLNCLKAFGSYSLCLSFDKCSAQIKDKLMIKNVINKNLHLKQFLQFPSSWHQCTTLHQLGLPLSTLWMEMSYGGCIFLKHPRSGAQLDIKALLKQKKRALQIDNIFACICVMLLVHLPQRLVHPYFNQLLSFMFLISQTDFPFDIW